MYKWYFSITGWVCGSDGQLGLTLPKQTNWWNKKN